MPHDYTTIQATCEKQHKEYVKQIHTQTHTKKKNNKRDVEEGLPIGVCLVVMWWMACHGFEG